MDVPAGALFHQIHRARLAQALLGDILNKRTKLVHNHIEKLFNESYLADSARTVPQESEPFAEWLSFQFAAVNDLGDQVVHRHLQNGERPEFVSQRFRLICRASRVLLDDEAMVQFMLLNETN